MVKFNWKKIKEVAMVSAGMVFLGVLLYISVIRWGSQDSSLIRQKWIYCFIGEGLLIVDLIIVCIAMHYHQVSNDYSDDIFGARLVLAVTLIFMIYYAAGYIYFEYFVEQADATRFLGKAIVLGGWDVILLYKLKRGKL